MRQAIKEFAEGYHKMPIDEAIKSDYGLYLLDEAAATIENLINEKH